MPVYYAGVQPVFMLGSGCTGQLHPENKKAKASQAWFLKQYSGISLNDWPFPKYVYGANQG